MNKNLRRIAFLSVAAIVGFDANASSNEASPTESIASMLSRAQLAQALDEGVDLTKTDFRPGLHIIPLAESWSTEDQAAAAKEQIKQQQEQGFYRAGAKEIMDVPAALKSDASRRSSRVPRHDRSFTSLEEISPRLAVTPVDLGTSKLSAATLVELRLAGGFVNGHWTGLTRTFDVRDLGFVVLNETDHAAGKESVSIIKEWLNIDVNGHPGTAKTARDSKGRTMVVVGWANERKIYSLRLQPINPEQLDLNQARLLEIARGLVEG